MKSLSITAIALAAAGTAAAATVSSEPFTLRAPDTITIEAIQNRAQEGYFDTSGIRLTGSLYKLAASRTYYHELTLSLGYASGKQTLGPENVEYTYIPLTVGYNANTDLTDKVTFYAGARAGFVYMKANPSAPVPNWNTPADKDNDTYGFTIGVGMGLKFQMTEKTHIQVGYEIGKTYPSNEEGYWNSSLTTRTISVGVGTKF